MKTTAKIALIVAGGVALGTSVAAISASQAGGWGKHGGKGSHMRQIIQEIDTNKDGVLTEAEITATRDAKMSEFDTSGDRSLSLDEFAALWSDFTRTRMVDRFQMLDDNGDGQVTEAEFAAPFTMMISYLDRNDDGQITKDEMRRGHRWKHRDHDDDDDD